MLTSFNIISMLSIQPDVCIIRKASWKSGGLMRQARGSRKNRIALRNNSLVRRIHLLDIPLLTSTGYTLAYTIDDGHGGKVHVNVSFSLLLSVHLR